VDNNDVSLDTGNPSSTTPTTTDNEFANSEDRHIYKSA